MVSKQEFFGQLVCREDMIFYDFFSKINSISWFLSKNTQIKKNPPNQSSYEGDTADLKSTIFSKKIVTAGQMKQIDVRVKNLYALEVQYAYKYLKRKEMVRCLVIEREHELPLNMQPQKQP